MKTHEQLPMMKTPEQLPTKSEQLPTKKVYHAPKLTEYGTLTEMTTAILFGMGAKDNGLGLTKTA